MLYLKFQSYIPILYEEEWLCVRYPGSSTATVSRLETTNSSLKQAWGCVCVCVFFLRVIRGAHVGVRHDSFRQLNEVS
jgi:hypothetical protein